MNQLSFFIFFGIYLLLSRNLRNIFPFNFFASKPSLPIRSSIFYRNDGVAEGGMGEMDVEGGIAMKLWSKFRSESVFVNYTPFFVCLAAGNLNGDVFLQYELAEECADVEEDKKAIRKLRNYVQNKLKSHDSLVREWGFELPEQSTLTNGTVKYMEFLLATASGRIDGARVPSKLATPFEKTKVAAYTLGAIAPCMRLFAFINKAIQALLDPNDSSHIYKKWIDHYCSQNFEAYAFQIEELLDTLSVSLTGEELDVIEKVYYQSMRLELDFFSSQPIMQEAVVPLSQMLDPAVGGQLTIFCDFDLTCTAFDSSAILAEIAIITMQKADLDGPETQFAWMSSADLRSTWDALSTQYTEEFVRCVDSIIPTETVKSFSYESLYEALEQFANFEKKANSRVVQSGVLKGLNQEDIKKAGQGLILPDGCKGFFQKVMKNENLATAVHILSYCWCGDLIRSAFLSGDLKALNVHSNELACEESITTGEIIKKFESPMEKLQAFNNILNDKGKDCQHLTVYIGGSVGDLLCLLEADIGIVMGSSPTLRRLGEQFGVSFMPLFSGLVMKQREVVEVGSSKWKKLSGTLYTVSSWDEIHAFILGS
ncbi:bifunctional TH2 protein, mitochondrial-like isoform X2 [Durio zibethinus]|uniref:Bifunctional TH2 protein, mitochondrial-like isoform X2 n=1 Tax=Durio zibethinus TaxID=66656 RepID=A0A6P6A1D6_DURZI|nr:bifunctional TH2 protein, mitochondrial-like isoform X2 [Durio zibethinus]